MTKYLSKPKRLAAIVLVGIFASWWFNRPLYHELIQSAQYRVTGEDPVVAQYIYETSRLKLIQGINPFSDNPLIYPFKSSVISGDYGLINLLPYSLFRVFLPINASMQAILILSCFAAYITMYILLRRLGITFWLRVLASTAFAYMPFISGRIFVHYTYINHYFFPLVSIMVHEWWHAPIKKRLFLAALVGITIGLSLYSTFYYFYMIGLSVFLYGLSLAVIQKKRLIEVFPLKDVAIAAIGCFVVGMPILTTSYMLQTQTKQYETAQLGQSLYTARPLSIFLPSQFNPYYQQLITDFRHWIPGEGVVYPGLFVLIGLSLYYISRKKIATQYVYAGMIVFGILYWLMLGDQIRDISWWNKSYNQVSLPIPSLYKLFSFILPAFNALRAPARFAVPMTFLGIICAAFGYQQYIKQTKKLNSAAIIISLSVIILIDQKYSLIDSQFQNIKMPIALYKQIEADKDKAPLMELPMTLRDGIEDRGDPTAVNFMLGGLIHHHPMVGGYVSRLTANTFQFYDDCYVTRVAGYLSQPKSIMDQQELIHQIEAVGLQVGASEMNLKYILVHKSLSASEKIVDLFKKSGYSLKSEDDIAYLLILTNPIFNSSLQANCRISL